MGAREQLALATIPQFTADRRVVGGAQPQLGRARGGGDLRAVQRRLAGGKNRPWKNPRSRSSAQVTACGGVLQLEVVRLLRAADGDRAQ